MKSGDNPDPREWQALPEPGHLRAKFALPNENCKGSAVKKFDNG
jgi:hypothetical protein